MLTLSQLNQAAQAKKATAMEKTVAAVSATAHKVADIAEVAKDAVAGAFPTSHKALDKRTAEIITTLGEPIARLEQRVEGLETVVGAAVQIEEEKVTEYVGGLMARMKLRGKNAAGQPIEAKQEEAQPEVQEAAAPAEPKPSKAQRRPAPIPKKDEQAPAQTTKRTTRLRLN